MARKRPDPDEVDCEVCRIRPAVEDNLCKICHANARRKARAQARQHLSALTPRQYAETPRPEREKLHAAAEQRIPAQTSVKPGPTGAEIEQTAIDAIRRWRREPWTFAREVLGFIPDRWQSIILHAVVGQDIDGNPLPPGTPYDKIALKACKGPGKTCVEAVIAWWFLVCFEDPNILATSVTGENLRDNLWKEMAYWQAKSDLLKNAYEWNTGRIFLKDRPETWWMSARTWPKDSDKTQQANTLAGLHARNTLLILDESGDIPEAVMVAGLAHHSTQDVGDANGQVHITLQCGNPTNLDGSLGVACIRDRAKWFVYEITGDPKDPDRAPRMSVTWCQEQIDTYGEDNPWVLVNVFGKFPPVGADKLLGPEQVRLSMATVTDISSWREQARVMALDVARSVSRDRSALCRRQGSVVFPFRVYRLDNSEDLIGQVALEFSRWRCDSIIVDVVGVGGPVYDGLKALGLPVVAFYGNQQARDPARFFDRRTETWWDCAQEIKGAAGIPRLALPRSAQELIGELTAPKLHFVKGKIKLESKEDMLKRGVQSPDVADALTMTFAEPAIFQVRIAETTRRALGQGRVQMDYDVLDTGDARGLHNSIYED